MSELLNSMFNRGSIRKFDSNKKVPQKILDNILKAIHQTPSYINGQQYSIIIVDDKNKRDKLVEITRPSSGKAMTFIKDAPLFMLFVMDFNKINHALEVENSTMEVVDSMESLLIGTVDIGIALEAATVVAESSGLGTVIVGAIRKSIKILIEEFNLPKYTFPIAGICIGYPHEGVSSVKTPRLPLDSLVYHNTYQLKNFNQILKIYNDQMKEFYSKKGLELTWTELITKYYHKSLHQDMKDVYLSQGFQL